MRNRFDNELQTLDKTMHEMGELCESSISLCIEALMDGNPKKAQEVVAKAVTISRKEREVENMCLKLLMEQQPVATDLRVISAALKMVSDLERIGDQSNDIAEIVITENLSAANDILNLRRMADVVNDMVTSSIEAFVNRDAELARHVIARDDEVDEAFNDAKQKLIEVFSGKNNVNMEYALNLLMIAKYFERIGDHTVNIAQWVLFAITGVREGNTN